MSTPIWIVVVIALVVAVAALVAFATGRATLSAGAPAGLEPERPVLLGEDPRAEDLERVRLAVAVPGYHRGQVDELVGVLQETLGRRERRIAELEERLHSAAPEHALEPAHEPDGAALSAAPCGEGLPDPR